MARMDYETVAGRAEHLEVVKGSRFIAWVAPAGDADEAAALVAEARKEHPDATHHCWAYRCGADQRFSDDGEPGGTAGRPMLEVILRRDLDYVVTVVIRYFGGTRLGAGGLVRAYSGATARVLDVAGTKTVLQREWLELRVPFGLADSLFRFIAAEAEVRTEDQVYDADGLVLTVSIPAGLADGLVAAVTEQTHGAASVRRDAVPAAGEGQ